MQYVIHIYIIMGIIPIYVYKAFKVLIGFAMLWMASLTQMNIPYMVAVAIQMHEDVKCRKSSILDEGRWNHSSHSPNALLRRFAKSRVLGSLLRRFAISRVQRRRVCGARPRICGAQGQFERRCNDPDDSNGKICLRYFSNGIVHGTSHLFTRYGKTSLMLVRIFPEPSI